MKVKILKNVVVGREVKKAGTVCDLPNRIAGPLLDRGFAEEATEAPPQQPQQPPPTP